MTAEWIGSASVEIGFVPFVVLEGSWTLAALAALARRRE